MVESTIWRWVCGSMLARRWRCVGLSPHEPDVKGALLMSGRYLGHGGVRVSPSDNRGSVARATRRPIGGRRGLEVSMDGSHPEGFHGV